MRLVGLTFGEQTSGCEEPTWPDREAGAGETRVAAAYGWVKDVGKGRIEQTEYWVLLGSCNQLLSVV